MQLVTNLDSPPWQGERTVLSIGAYDGVHLGQNDLPVEYARRIFPDAIIHHSNEPCGKVKFT